LLFRGTVSAAEVFELRCPIKKGAGLLSKAGGQSGTHWSVPASQFHLKGQWNFLIRLLLRSWPPRNEILCVLDSPALLRCTRPDFRCNAPSLWIALRAKCGLSLHSAMQLIGSQKSDAQMVQLLPSRPTRASSTISGSTLTAILVVGGIVAALYFGREVLVPIALALLLSFVLAPLVRRLQSWRFPRIIAVAIVAIFAFAIIFGSRRFHGVASFTTCKRFTALRIKSD
jgi:hypothetical protein